MFLTTLFVTHESQAQTAIGVRGGLNSSKLVYYFDNRIVGGQEALNKVELGVLLEHGLSSRFDYLLELNYFESGVSIPSIPFKLTAISLESNSILKFKVLEGSWEPSVFAGLGINKYLRAYRGRRAIDLDDDSINALGVGYLVGVQLDYAIRNHIMFFDARFKNSLRDFIDDDKNEDFTINVKKQETVFSIGFNFRLN